MTGEPADKLNDAIRGREGFAGRSMPAHRKSSAPEAEPHAADARTRFLGNPVPESSIFSSSVIGKNAACMLKYVLRGSFIFVHLSGRLKDDLKPSQNGDILIGYKTTGSGIMEKKQFGGHVPGRGTGVFSAGRR